MGEENSRLSSTQELASVPAGAESARTPRVRLTRDERQRQLVGIGLRFLTQRPIQDVSLDEVAREAGISRSLLFHYFPTKTAFYEAVVAAAGRRVARTVRPDEGVHGLAAIEQFLERYIAQIDRRRELYLALVHGSLTDLGGAQVLGTLREVLTDNVCMALSDSGIEHRAVVVHAWVAYVEDLTLTTAKEECASDEGRPRRGVHELRQHCLDALRALLAVPFDETDV